MKEKKQDIIAFFRDLGRPISFRDAVKRLNVKTPDNRESFKGILKELEREGIVIKIRDGRFGLSARMNLLTGSLSRHPDGFGFVIPEDGGEDVYVSPRKLMGAMHGDKVIVRVEGYKRTGKKQGSIIRILERAHKRVVGRFQKTKAGAVIIPSDGRVCDSVLIAPDGTMGAKDGEIVDAEIIRWPMKFAPGAGRIVEVLGDKDDPDVEIEVIAKKYGLPRRFPPAVLSEVKEIPTEVKEGDLKGRVDLTGLKIFTIDGESAKDFDDAVGIERTKTGYKLFVSIADVSHYVKEGTAADSEAYLRGTSVYFPARCIPMLPEALSNDICSLNPGLKRLTVTAELRFDDEGVLKERRFYESVIASRERLTYTEVKKILTDKDPGVHEKYSHITADLNSMETLAMRLNNRRLHDGSIDFDLPEPEIIIDIEGRPQDIVKGERNIAHKIIEEFMLSANRAVAEFFDGKDCPFLYRIHSAPEPSSIEDFREFVKAFGYTLDEKISPKTFQRLLKAAMGKPEEKLINHVLLRSMKQAQYSEKNCGHFGLAFADYTHFTSPIRRYPDLVVHRLLKKLLYGKYDAKEKSRMSIALPAAASHTSKRERYAMEAEREIVDLKKAQYMLDKVGLLFDGFVSGVTSFGVFVELKDYFVEGLVHISTLTDDYYIFKEKAHSLVGETTKKVFRPGVEVKVRIVNVDIEKKRIEMELAKTSLINKSPGRGRF